MALKKKTGNKKQSKPLVYVLEGVFGALAMSLGLVALAALLMQKQVLPIESTRILNPAVKAFCALFAALLGARKQKKTPLAHGCALRRCLYCDFTCGFRFGFR